MASAVLPVMSDRRAALLGGLLASIGPVSMALYTPAMTEIVQAFATTEARVKLTLALYFGGFACAQLVAGPLSDAIGRRPVTFGFMGIYGIASLVALFAPTVEILMAARFAQGIGAAAGITIARALVRDLFTGEKSARVMNVINIILALGPAMAPTIGGLLLVLAGWRSVFVAMALLGIAVISLSGAFMRETVVPDVRRLQPGALARTYGTVLGDARFRAAATVVAGALGAIYAQSTFLPFILMGRVGLTPAEFGAGMLFQSGAFIGGSLAVARIMRRRGAEAAVAPGLALVAVGSLGSALLHVWEPSFLRVMIPVAIFAVGIAFVLPAMTTAALAPFPSSAGAASAMLGFLQMGSGLVVGLLGAWLGDAVWSMGTLIPAMGAVSCLGFLLGKRIERQGETGRPG
jgi:DHA1 family bicyclomycin/chloramphenicol resistance-like MFS transporter